MMNVLKIGARGSPLALAQARMVATALRDTHALRPEQIEIVPVVTMGDLVRDRPLSEIGGKELWTRELDAQLMDGRIDLSVHSMKDVETIRPPELEIAAILERAEESDRLVGADALESLPTGARVGTSSPRRAAQIRARRPDLVVVPIRGNVETRLKKLALGEADATLLAAAGLDRLGYHNTGSALRDLLPAPAQGAIGVEVRSANNWTKKLVQAIGHTDTETCVFAERRFLEALGGTCHSPIAALARIDGEHVHLRAEILSESGEEVIASEAWFPQTASEAPFELARDLLSRASPALRSLFHGLAKADAPASVRD